MPFSFRRDSEISPSEKSSQTAPCVFRSIRTPTLRPFSSVTNWIPVMALFSFRWRHTRIVHVQPRPRNSASLPFPPIFSGIQKGALSENLTKRPLLRNFLHPLNCEEPTLVTAIRLAMDERHRSGWFERDAEGVGLRLNWAGHGERLDEGVGIPGLSGLSAGD